MSYSAPVQLPELESPRGLVVRPDTLVVSLVATVDDSDPLRALGWLRGAAEETAARLRSLDPGARLEPRGLTARMSGSSKAGRDELDGFQLGGLVHLSLEPSLDFWQRATLEARLVSTLMAVSFELGRRKPAVRLSWRNPVPRVSDPLAFRERLTEARRLQLKALVGDLLNTVQLAGFEVPETVSQTPLSLDAVRLTLGGP
ncbi:MAG: hypothetical protein JNK72_19125 [Myxococcales bacterium]|nr:hypothetical protein [Myxococcales bacterium]